MTTEEKFCAAVQVIHSLPKNGPFQPSQNLLLKLSTYEQQATVGPCQVPRPSVLSSDRNKWHAWKKLGNMSKETAMEKYIEELSKVIETMSYTEAVSNFMDIMGPFYEIVWTDDQDTQQNDEMNDHSNCGISSEDHIIEKENGVYNHIVAVDDAIQVEHVPLERKTWVEAAPNDAHWHVYGYPEVGKTNAFVDFYGDSKSFRKKNLFSSKDLLALSVVNLQKSLDAIVEQLNSLESMAQTYQNHLQQVTPVEPKDKNWKFSPLSVIFAVSWPFVAYWLFTVFQRQRKSVKNR